MKGKAWLGVLALGGAFSLGSTVGWAADASLETRVKALEDAQKGQKAASGLSYTYRPRRGLLVEPADKSWGLNLSGRFHYRMMFWDSDAKPSAGFSQADLALRRVRQRTQFFWAKKFYEFDFEIDVGGDRSFQLQHGELHVNFSQKNPFLPDVTVGPRVSTFWNAHDTNWGSSTGGLFDRSMFQDGAGIGSGTVNNAIAFDWEDLEVGPGELLFEAVWSNQGLTNIADQERPNTGKRSWHLATNYKPFSKTKNKWINGLDVGVTYHADVIHPNDANGGRGFFQVRTTERNRLRLIELRHALDPESVRTYITPGFGWKVGPNWLRTAAAWNKGELDADLGDVKGRMWRVSDELFIWSPKGFLTGSTSTAGSVQLFAGFEQDTYEADDRGLRIGARAQDVEKATASNLNVGFWYYVRPALRVGAEYGRYRVDKIGRGAASLDDTLPGDKVTFDTFELGVTYDF